MSQGDPAAVEPNWETHAEQIATRWQLPARQRAALKLVLRGLSNKEIAGTMDCSVKGAEAHVSRLLRRANVTSRAELIAALSMSRG
jgi:DNA-binding NarL/FixJ family response regulator